MIDKNTKLYFSFAKKSGTFGSTLYNAAFEYLEYNGLYIPRESSDPYLLDLKSYLRIASGISLSMPFKKMVMPYVPIGYWQYSASIIGNVNTLKPQENGNIEAYNTDSYGFEKACELLIPNIKTASIFGKGAVSDSICHILRKNNVIVSIFGRDEIEKLNNIKCGDMLINASPVGMDSIIDDIFTEKLIEKYRYVFDVVVSPNKTNLIKTANKLYITAIPGWVMCKYQLEQQFNIYTGLIYPKEVMNKKLMEMKYV